MSLRKFAAALSLGTAALACTGVSAQESGLVAGSARVDITPSEAAMPEGMLIHSRLYVRAIVARSGGECAVLVGIDQGALREEMVADARARASEATGCDADNFVISATHTHSGSSTGLFGGEPTNGQVADAIVDAVTRANGKLRPARIGYGTDEVDLNVNRDLFVANSWVQGPNRSALSDKTLAVVEFIDDGGVPIGVFMNYAMHPVSFFLSGTVSADFPGATSRYVEEHFGEDTVAIFSQGASGDQNPRLQRPYNYLAALRTGNPNPPGKTVPAPKPWLPSDGDGFNVGNAMAAATAPLPAEKQAAYREALADNDRLVSAMGTILGETVIEMMRYDITRLDADVSIAGQQEAFQCPGRDRQDRDNPVRQGALPPYADGDPVNIGVGMVRIGDVHIATVDAEVYNRIAMRLKEESPASNLIVSTLSNGRANSGYIYSDDAASHLTFQVIGSRLKPGCAEDGIVNTGLDLIDQVRP